MNILLGIPARYDSTRFPGKPLALLQGKPMIRHVIDRALASRLGQVLLATDDERIAQVGLDAGIHVCMTSSQHQNGAERLAEAVRDIDCDIVVNIQGDEPLIETTAIHDVVQPFIKQPYLSMATLARPLSKQEQINDPNIVKVVCNAKNHAMYFSRSPIPYTRTMSAHCLQHIGLYAYRKEFLLIYPQLEACEHEANEQLEQLRVLHHGYHIAVSEGNYHSIGIDTPEDLQAAEVYLQNNNS